MEVHSRARNTQNIDVYIHIHTHTHTHTRTHTHHPSLVCLMEFKREAE